MTQEAQARFSMSRWHLQIAWIEIKAAVRALIGAHPWQENHDSADAAQ